MSRLARSAVPRRFRRRPPVGLSARFPVTNGGNEILERLAALHTSVWSYEWDDPTIRHLSPMSQDFAAAFGLGDNDLVINLLDQAGVALIAIQALCRRVTTLEAQLVQMPSGPSHDTASNPLCNAGRERGQGTAQ